MRAELVREIVATTIRNHPEQAWRPGAADRVSAFFEGIEVPTDIAIEVIRTALKRETIDPDCYPLPFWPEMYPPPFPAVPLADWI